MEQIIEYINKIKKIMTKFSEIKFAHDAITMLPNGGLMSSVPNIIFDGKTLNTGDSTLLWENIGTGTFSFQTNKMNMSVTSGQYCIRQSRRRNRRRLFSLFWMLRRMRRTKTRRRRKINIVKNHSG